MVASAKGYVRKYYSFFVPTDLTCSGLASYRPCKSLLILSLLIPTNTVW